MSRPNLFFALTMSALVVVVPDSLLAQADSRLESLRTEALEMVEADAEAGPGDRRHAFQLRRTRHAGI